MKEEEKTEMCVGHVDMRIESTNDQIVLVGEIKEVKPSIAKVVVNAISVICPCHLRVRRNKNTATLLFERELSKTCHIDKMQSEITDMNALLHSVGDVLIGLAHIKNMKGDLNHEAPTNPENWDNE